MDKATRKAEKEDEKLSKVTCWDKRYLEGCLIVLVALWRAIETSVGVYGGSSVGLKSCVVWGSVVGILWSCESTWTTLVSDSSTGTCLVGLKTFDEPIVYIEWKPH